MPGTRPMTAVTLSPYAAQIGDVLSRGDVKMEVSEPRARHRGFFLHSDTTGEPDSAELENPEGIVVRVRMSRASVPRQTASVAPRSMSRMSSSRHSDGRSRSDTDRDDSRPEIRSGSVTGSRQRAHLHR